MRNNVKIRHICVQRVKKGSVPNLTYLRTKDLEQLKFDRGKRERREF